MRTAFDSLKRRVTGFVLLYGRRVRVSSGSSIVTAASSPFPVRVRPLGAALVLAYHRIASLHPDTHHLCVTPENFREQVSYLAQNCEPMKLEDMHRAARDGTLPPRAGFFRCEKVRGKGV